MLQFQDTLECRGAGASIHYVEQGDKNRKGTCIRLKRPISHGITSRLPHWVYTVSLSLLSPLGSLAIAAIITTTNTSTLPPDHHHHHHHHRHDRRRHYFISWHFLLGFCCVSQRRHGLSSSLPRFLLNAITVAIAAADGNNNDDNDEDGDTAAILKRLNYIQQPRLETEMNMHNNKRGPKQKGHDKNFMFMLNFILELVTADNRQDEWIDGWLHKLDCLMASCISGG
uniref:Uncharacterized protein n=1 Tax=Glossina pallidipes TaxID=7398 RepID=A0A1A9ZC73_GLOPL